MRFFLKNRCFFLSYLPKFVLEKIGHKLSFFPLFYHLAPQHRSRIVLVLLPVMDTVTVVIIIIAAVLVLFGVLYCMKKRRQGRFQDDVKRVLQLELQHRLEELDAAVHRTVLEALNHFPSLDTQEDDDSSVVVAQLLRSMDDLISEHDESIPDAVELHAALLAEKAVLLHCEKGTSIFYNALDMLMQSEVGQVLRSNSDDASHDGDDNVEGGYRVPKAGCCYRMLCCVHKSWEKKQLTKRRRVWYYNLAHRICSGRTGQERIAGRSHGAESDDEIDFEMSIHPQRKYLYSGGLLRRHYAEVTKDAQPFVYIDNDGEVMVSATEGMWSKHESASWLRRCFSASAPVDESDDDAYFGAQHRREDVYSYLYNVDHLISNLNLSFTTKKSHDEIVRFDAEVKQWAQCVKQKLCIRAASRWSTLLTKRCEVFLNAPEIVLRMSAKSMESASETSRRIAQPLRTDIILRKFWSSEIIRFTRAMMCESSDAFRSDTLKRCCGYCLPIFPWLEKDYSDDQSTVSKQLTDRLAHRTWLCRMRDDEVKCVSDELARTKQRITETLLVRPRRASGGSEPEVAQHDHHHAAPQEATRDERPVFLDGPPMPPARTDLQFTPPNNDDDRAAGRNNSTTPQCVLRAIPGDVVRGVFEELQERLDVLVDDLEAECAALYLQEMWSGGAVAATQQEIQQVTSKASLDIRKHAAEIGVMCKVYQRTRVLCAAGRALSQRHASDDALQMVAVALHSLREVLLEAKEARNHFEEEEQREGGRSRTSDDSIGSSGGAGGLWMLLEQPDAVAADVVTGKRQLLFPWHRVLVSYNFYAQLLQKNPVTLQFIYSD
ncbi:transmembrane protein, putative [Bodo saltans]|uniref:Transmembrane protein, putative n=1 Tax=Bodo saltans TaxID=75058 RepID=A0A0S4JIW7_BODSA|nr:transmembrane protein, putative [Bodo saltans]|eukprot:CUG89186.1 transmembrane protein, putative [Bodo saltans]